MSRFTEWDCEQRKNLIFLLMSGYKLSELPDLMSKSYPSIKKELKRGLSHQDYVEQRYIRYNPMFALENLVKDLIGEEDFKELMEYENGKRK